MDRCPICLNLHSVCATVTKTHPGFISDCPVCGRFGVSEEAWDDWLDPDSAPGSRLSSADRARLSHRIRSAQHSGSTRFPTMDSTFIEQFIKSGCPGPNPADQIINIIKYIGDEVSRSGERVFRIPFEFFVIVGSISPAFVVDLVSGLKSRDLVDCEFEPSGLLVPYIMNMTLTIDGWETYEAERRGQTSGNYGFLAMKFGDVILETLVADVIKPTIRSGIKHDLFDNRDLARAGVIDNLMRAHIRDSAFLIVDLTHDNSGAYWEAGYGEGLGKPVIYLCERGKFENAQTHFDTNHCTTILWDTVSTDLFGRELIATLRRSLNLFETR